MDNSASNSANIIGVVSRYLQGAGVANLDQLRALVCDAPDRQKHYVLYEYAAALEQGLLPWELIPIASLERVGAHRYRTVYLDYGTDIASPSLDVAGQVKWQAPKSGVSFRAMSTFYTYSGAILKSKDLRLITSPDVHIRKPGDRLGAVHTTITPQRVVQLLAPALEYVPPALPPVTKLKLWPHQVAALEAIAVSPTGGRVSMACGTGKSVVMARAVQAWVEDPPEDGPSTGHMYVLLVPSLLLLEQTLSTFEKWAPDVPIAALSGEHHLPADFAGLVVSTYQSVKKVAGIDFTGVVVDEAHHADNNGVEGGSLDAIATITERSPRTLRFSATFDDEVDPNEIIYSYTLDQAIDDGYLTDYEIVVPSLRPFVEVAASVAADEETPKLDSQPALAGAIANHPTWGHVLAYCNERPAGQRFVEECKAAGLTAAYFDGDTSLEERRKIISRFERGAIRVLSTVRVLGEGVDIPIADTCMFVEPRGSHVNVVQCLGRVLRLHPTKSMARVILPALDEQAELRRFMRLIQDADPRVTRSMSTHKGLGRVALMDISPSATSGERTEEAVEEAQIAFESTFDRFGVGTKHGTKGRFEQKLTMLEKYVEKHGKLPAQKTKVGGFALGLWCDTQRKRYKEGKLPIDREKDLERIPGWCWDLLEQAFQEHLAQLAAYVEQHGKLPVSKIRVGGFSLGKWCATQRKFYKKGTLSADREKALEAISGWYWPTPE